jgi:hypothetical protein
MKTPKKSQNGNNSQEYMKDDWGALSLDMSTYTLPPGVYDAEIIDAKVQQNADADTLWAFITIEMANAETGELTSVEEPFMTIAAKEGSSKRTQVLEGLRRFAMYCNAAGVEANGRSPFDVVDDLVGRSLCATIARTGKDLRLRNRVSKVVPCSQT